MLATTRKYQPIVEVLEVKAAGEKVWTEVSISGSFPGSPVRLLHTFTLTRDGIARLEIG